MEAFRSDSIILVKISIILIVFLSEIISEKYSFPNLLFENMSLALTGGAGCQRFNVWENHSKCSRSNLGLVVPTMLGG